MQSSASVRLSRSDFNKVAHVVTHAFTDYTFMRYLAVDAIQRALIARWCGTSSICHGPLHPIHTPHGTRACSLWGERHWYLFALAVNRRFQGRASAGCYCNLYLRWQTQSARRATWKHISNTTPASTSDMGLSLYRWR
jgi:hypothetical protein